MVGDMVYSAVKGRVKGEGDREGWRRMGSGYRLRG